MRLGFERIITWLSRAPPLLPASGSEIQVEANIQKIYGRQFQDRCGKKYDAEEKEKKLLATLLVILIQITLNNKRNGTNKKW